MAQLDHFLKIDGIPGESTDAKHPNEIEVLSYKFGMKNVNSGSRSTSGSAGGGRIAWDDFDFEKLQDKATPKLLQYACSGEHIKNAILTSHQAAGGKEKVLEIKMTDILISSFTSKQPNAVERQAAGGDGTGLNRPMEHISFNCGSLLIIYHEADHQTGKIKGTIQAGWDMVKNIKV